MPLSISSIPMYSSPSLWLTLTQWCFHLTIVASPSLIFREGEATGLLHLIRLPSYRNRNPLDIVLGGKRIMGAIVVVGETVAQIM